MQADFSDNSHGRPLLAWDAYRDAGVVNTQVFPVRTQRNAPFQGLYTYLDLFDGTWRDREGYGDDQFFKAGHGAFDADRPLVEYRFEKKNPDDDDFTPLAAFLDGVDLTGTAQRNYLLANADIPQMINYAVVTAIVQHVDSSHEELLPRPGRRHRPVGDHPVGPRPHLRQRLLRRQQHLRDPGRARRPDQRADAARCSPCPSGGEMYFRRLRTRGQRGARHRAAGGALRRARSVRRSRSPRWTSPRGPARRQRDLRQPADASCSTPSRPGATCSPTTRGCRATSRAAPNIVINEIQHSPGRRHRRGVRRSCSTRRRTEAIDLSGWTITGGITLTIQPGTVILPRGTMTFVANDPAFRATYGSTVFVGGIYTGDLAGQRDADPEPGRRARSPTPSPTAAPAGRTPAPARPSS